MQYPDYDTTADIEVINNNIKKLVQNAKEQDTQIKSKEPIINKKTGFNLDKTDLTENDTNKLLTGAGAYKLLSSIGLFTYTITLNSSLKETLRNKFGEQLTPNRKGEFLVFLHTGVTDSTTGNVYILRNNNGISWEIISLGNDYRGSNHPYLIIENNVPKICLAHPNNYVIEVSLFGSLGAPGVLFQFLEKLNFIALDGTIKKSKTTQPLDSSIISEENGIKVNRSSVVNSSSEDILATLKAVKLAYDKGKEALDKANLVETTLGKNKADKTIQILAGNGLSGGGDLTNNRTLNIISIDDGIVINPDNIKLNIVDSLSSSSTTRPLSANAGKLAYNKGVEALNKGIEALNKANEMTPSGGSNKTAKYLEDEVNRSAKLDITNEFYNRQIIRSSSTNASLSLNRDSSGFCGEIGVIREDSNSLNYATYWAYDLTYNTTTKKFDSLRTNLGNKLIALMGNHEGGFAILAQEDLAKPVVPSARENCKEIFKVRPDGNGYLKSSLILTLENINKSYCPYRVGDIMQTSNSQNPATVWMGTVWERIANGRVIVGIDENDPLFNAVGRSGGSKTHILTVSEIAPHTHTTRVGNTDGQDRIQVGGETERGAIMVETVSTSTGGGQPHNNLQPYIAFYNFRRIG